MSPLLQGNALSGLGHIEPVIAVHRDYVCDFSVLKSQMMKRGYTCSYIRVTYVTVA